jgi:hypothetical protein
MTDHFSDENRDRAMEYLAETDELAASLKANEVRTEYLAKVAEALAFRMCEGSVEAKKAEAKTMPNVLEAWKEHFQAIQDYELVKAKRARAVLVVDTWRSVNANRRAGNV